MQACELTWLKKNANNPPSGEFTTQETANNL
jgi:hypothetical protein